MGKFYKAYLIWFGKILNKVYLIFPRQQKEVLNRYTPATVSPDKVRTFKGTLLFHTLSQDLGTYKEQKNQTSL